MSGNIYRNTIEQPSDRVIVALDNMDWQQAGLVMSEVGEYVGLAKANSLAQIEGWQYTVGQIATFGAKTMADAKFHDIPETVRLHVKAVASCRPSLITVHASGGEDMLKKAVEGRNEGVRDSAGVHPEWTPQPVGILGITVLTSLDVEQCQWIYGDMLEKKVLQFARLALEAGIDGIVCSGKELRAIRADSALDALITVVPGITPTWAKKAGDQKRVVTPTEALQHGADFEVIGRAITQPPEGISRAEAAQRITEELKEAA
jgi:orotidine-5'-phosphate decarboxylase